MKKTLFLSLKKEPFNVMVTGEKGVEFRDPTKWIKSRLLNKDGTRKHFDEVKFVNGYGGDKPFFVADFLGFGTTKEHNFHKYSNGLEVIVKIGDVMIYLGKVKKKGNLNEA